MNKKKITIKLILLLVFMTGNSILLRAQELIKSNDKSIRYDLIKPAHYYKRLITYDTTGKITDEDIIESLVKVDTARKEILFVTSDQWPVGRLNIDSCINNSSGSVSYVYTTIPVIKRDAVIFHPKSVDSHLYLKGVVTDYTTPMPDGYFDDTSVSNLYAYMDIKKGIKYELNCYGSNTRAIIKFHVEYVFDEPINTRTDTAPNCKVLHITHDGSSYYLWIDPKTHLTLKAVYPDKNGYTVIQVL